MPLSLYRSLIIAVIWMSASACQNKPAETTVLEPTPSPPIEAPIAQATPDPPAAPQQTEQKVVTVEAKGSSFDPPVQITQLPDGVWYCDMGTSHYARTEKGDGKCERCKMDLKHKTAAAAAAPEHDHHHEH